ncbi:AlpA family transcriptional regulator [Klebsiella sp. BIGb0407]|uniref:helix-turn-helix transcriptional regulator n=1 Tax=Klebsiella sp. BIGb0407 TaxID=2940603 RepID=UPI002169AFC5|nr:AlpA family transcriptional regulator [Klebsiella sp. BIGb0407]MCS3434035.1 prophage regulatory protein [Klebsiella sp. BIGb0407]
MKSQQILRIKEVIARTGLSRATIYRQMACGRFPQCFSLTGEGGRAVGWLEESVNGWIQSCSGGL